MKVGLLTTGFPRFEGDHAGAFLLTLARGLVAEGHTVRVLAPEPGAARERPRWQGVEVQWVPYARPRALQRTFYRAGAPDNLRTHPWRWAGAATFTGSLLRVARRALDECDTLVSSWAVPSGWVASAVAEGRDHLAICHATDIRWLQRAPGGGALARQIAAGATSLWFLSPSHRDRFFDAAKLDPSTTASHTGPMPIERAIEPEQTRGELRRSLGIDRFTLLFLGRLVRVKGVDQLLRAAARVREPIHVRIAGDGPERRPLMKLARRLGVDATFEGWVAGARKESLLRACDAIVVPSRPRDGLPTVLFEARARALPIIASRVGAIQETFETDTRTRLVPPDDPMALSEAIRSLQGVTRSVPLGGR